MRFRVAVVVAGLGLVLIGLLFEFRRLVRSSRRSAEAPPPTEPEEAEPAVAAAPPSAPRPSFAGSRAERRPARSGAGHLHGRVVWPKGARETARETDEAGAL